MTAVRYAEIRFALEVLAIITDGLILWQKQGLVSIGRIVDIPFTTLHKQDVKGERIIIVRPAETGKKSVALAV